MTYFFERKHKLGFAPVREGCYSLKQALWLATHHPYDSIEDYEFFGITAIENGKWRVIKNYVKE